MDRVQSVEELQGVGSRRIRRGRQTVIHPCLDTFRCVFRGLDRNKSYVGQHRAVIEAST